jgi:hypothetical protein
MSEAKPAVQRRRLVPISVQEVDTPGAVGSTTVPSIVRFTPESAAEHFTGKTKEEGRQKLLDYLKARLSTNDAKVVDPLRSNKRLDLDQIEKQAFRVATDEQYFLGLARRTLRQDKNIRTAELFGIACMLLGVETVVNGRAVDLEQVWNTRQQNVPGKSDGGEGNEDDIVDSDLDDLDGDEDGDDDDVEGRIDFAAPDAGTHEWIDRDYDLDELIKEFEPDKVCDNIVLIEPVLSFARCRSAACLVMR